MADGNLNLARHLAKAAQQAERPVRVVYANSTHSRGGSVYGLAKRQAADVLAAAVSGFSDVVLPNLYGEHGRPRYNSFVATFCDDVANGREPVVTKDRELPLLHAQDAAEALIREACVTGQRVVEPPAEPVKVSAVAQLLRDFDSPYRHGELPDITSRFRATLFNTYRSHLFPTRYPIPLRPSIDARGTLVECVRTGAAGGQAFVSTTAPAAVRGEHVHLRKLERFVVVDGEAEIALRKLFTSQVVTFRVSGARPAIVDIPTMWVHSLTNVGDHLASTFFWTNELYSAADPDTYACPVTVLGGAR